MRYFTCTVGRQEVIAMKLSLTDKGASWQMKLRQWASDNALTLVFMSVMFAITWAVIILATVWDVVANGR